MRSAVTRGSGARRAHAPNQVLVENARVGGRRVDVRLIDGVVAAVGELGRERHDRVLAADGGEIIGGLHDHHLHVLAAAARRDSVSLRSLDDLGAILLAIGRAATRVSDSEWIRVVDYREEAPAAGERPAQRLDRSLLDGVAPANPVRVQDATGGLWVLNSRALERVPADLIAARVPGDAEVDTQGVVTGRFHRMDAELAAVWPKGPGDLRRLGADLLRLGITGLTDATPTTDADRIRVLTAAHAAGDLPQDLQILADRKIVLSDHALPDVEHLCARIAAVHATGRPVALHSVTLESGYLACHALATVGVLPGDRLEHAALSTPDLVRMIAELGLTVVTQPGFVADRGEMYRRALEPAERDGLYRYRSFLDAGVRVAPSSDHPFGPLSPWTAIRAAAQRRTEAGSPLAEHEAVDPSVVLRGYQSPLRDPGVRSRGGGGGRGRSAGLWSDAALSVGARADLCLLRAPLREVLASLTGAAPMGESSPAGGDPSPVAAALIGTGVWRFDE